MTVQDPRHEGADPTPVTVERSDAIDAAGALQSLASGREREARSRGWSGPRFAHVRAQLRAEAAVYRAAADRMQRAADTAVTGAAR